MTENIPNSVTGPITGPGNEMNDQCHESWIDPEVIVPKLVLIRNISE